MSWSFSIVICIPGCKFAHKLRVQEDFIHKVKGVDSSTQAKQVKKGQRKGKSNTMVKYLLSPQQIASIPFSSNSPIPSVPSMIRLMQDTQFHSQHLYAHDQNTTPLHRYPFTPHRPPISITQSLQREPAQKITLSRETHPQILVTIPWDFRQW